ncbi:MarR family winged helix-turn-helix transcriptional regulator [Amycolatopsis nigrescens]|uniref:MarR family winged helix-turn-helix transcriptional regulator n=1 Tax=Amycolatopsis nigrescens TaxID=381445 RepID=UPI00037EE4D5|nr:MarR family transcriptional regulator [Amycolatopsis nigrescens]
METAATETGKEIGFATALVRLSHLVQQVFAEVSRERELTPQQAQLLCMLIDGPIGMTELSRLLNLEKSSLTGLVDRVERRGLVARARDSHDRRACRIAVTEQGSRTGADAHQAVITRLEALAEEVPPADKRLLADVVAQMLAVREGG